MLGNKRSSLILTFTIILSLSIFTSCADKPKKESKEVTTQYITLDSVTDVNDDRKLVGISHNVFIGTVQKQTGNKKLGGIPETQFEVKVLENIKGDLKEKVVVNQQGGLVGDTLILFQDDKVLEVGESYLFVTRHNTAEDWNTVVPAVGDIELDSDLKRKEMAERYSKAYKEEIKFESSREANSK